MSDATPERSEGQVASPAWRIRQAMAGDVPPAAAAVGELLEELGGRRPAPAELETEARALVEDPELGALLVAEADGKVIGVLAASFTRAMHVPGRYAVIQDLWVDPAWRSRSVGAELVEAIAAVARRHGMERIEVGLPREDFAAIKATEGFYARNEFASLGIRMRRLLS